MLIKLILNIKSKLNFFRYYIGIILKSGNKSVYFQLKRLKEIDGLSDKNKEEIILKKLNHILLYCYQHVNYYTKFFKKIGWVDKKNKFVKINSLYQLKKLPVITKEIIRQNFDDLTSNDKNLKVFKNSSGGSTGEKAIFLQENDFVIGNRVSSLYFLSKLGLNPWNKNCLLLWGSTDDIGKGKLPKNLFLHYLFNDDIKLNTADFSSENLSLITKILSKVRFDYIRGYSQSLYLLAKYINSNGFNIKQKLVISTADKLTKKMSEEIIKAFDCKLYDFYGSREVGAISYCVVGKKHKVLWFNNYIENEIVKDGPNSELLVTNLYNKAMPLIRYKINDQVLFDKNSKTHFNFSSLDGRTTEIFKTYDGKSVAGPTLNHMLNSLETVSQFQIIQEKLNLISFKIVSNKKISSDKLIIVENDFKKIFGKECKFNWDFVTDIPKSSSGKKLFIISKI